MVSVDKIEDTLKWLEKCYDNSKDTYIKESRIYSKMAVLELSGWVEESMDGIILNLADKKLDSKNARRRLEKIILNVNGFTYEKHFLKMLRKSIGIINEESIKKQIYDRADGTLNKFKTALDKLYNKRNPLAHTFSQEQQQRFDSPSQVRGYYNDICSGLKAFEEEIAKAYKGHKCVDLSECKIVSDVQYELRASEYGKVINEYKVHLEFHKNCED